MAQIWLIWAKLRWMLGKGHWNSQGEMKDSASSKHTNLTTYNMGNMAWKNMGKKSPHDPGFQLCCDRKSTSSLLLSKNTEYTPRRTGKHRLIMSLRYRHFWCVVSKCSHPRFCPMMNIFKSIWVNLITTSRRDRRLESWLGFGTSSPAMASWDFHGDCGVFNGWWWLGKDGSESHFVGIPWEFMVQ